MSGDDRSAGANLALLRFLHHRGTLTDVQLTRLEPRATAGPLGALLEVIETQCLVRERHIAELLAETLRLPLVDLSELPLDRALAGLVREQVATRHELVPIRADDRTIEIAMANPLDREALKAVEFATSRQVRLAVATATDVRHALTSLYRLDDSLTAFLGTVRDEGEVEAVHDRPESEFGVIDTELPPVVKLADRILSEATTSRASDVHIEPATDAVVVRYRIDGILEEAFRFPRWLHQPLVGRLKVMARLDIAERRVPQDGRTKVRIRGQMVDFRVSSLPTHVGEKITLRILDASRGLRPLEELGLEPDDLRQLREAARRPEGMILVTGPTGSGKTTTLYALLRELTSVASNIVTIENPVEYRIEGLNQVDINDRQGLNFAGVLRSVLRQDPDVILVGEIRDTETAQVAFQAAQTGHLVLSTLHTNDAVATITRLLDLGVDPFLIVSSLHLVLAQRLVRRICPTCAAPDEHCDEPLRKLPLPPEIVARLARGEGCSQCRGTGYAGRVGLYEVLPVSPAISRLVESRAGETQLRDQARREGRRLLLDDAAEKLRTGATTVDEVLRVVQIDTSALRCPSCRREIDEEFSLCPHCGTTLNPTCDGCTRRLEPDWTRCPYCGTDAPLEGPGGVRYEARTFKALVVDDDVELRTVVRTTLECGELGLVVLTAQDGAEALALAAIERPDIVVMDFTMPGMNGPETCRRLRADPATAHVPVLMLTAHDDDAHVRAGFEAGVDDYVRKPFRREELLARVRRMLERSYGRARVTQPVREAP